MTFSRMGLWLNGKFSTAGLGAGGLSAGLVLGGSKLGGGLVLGVVTWVMLAGPSYATCRLFPEVQQFNTQVLEDAVVIGQQPRRPYKVILVSDDINTLSELRICVGDAFVTRSRLGSYIQVGSFGRRDDAEAIRRILQRSGYRARVTYGR